MPTVVGTQWARIPPARRRLASWQTWPATGILSAIPGVAMLEIAAAQPAMGEQPSRNTLRSAGPGRHLEFLLPRSLLVPARLIRRQQTCPPSISPPCSCWSTSRAFGPPDPVAARVFRPGPTLRTSQRRQVLAEPRLDLARIRFSDLNPTLLHGNGFPSARERYSG